MIAGDVMLSEAPIGIWALAAVGVLLVAVFVSVIVIALLRTSASRRIGRVVGSSPAEGPAARGAIPLQKEEQTRAPVGSSSLGVHPPPELAIETVDIDDLPAVGAAYEVRRTAHLSRGPAIRRIYRRAAVMLAIPIALVLVANGALVGDLNKVPLWVPILLAVTLGFVYLAASASPPRRSIGPRVMPLLGAIWVACATAAAWTIVAEGEGRWWIVPAGIVAIVAVTLLWLRWTRMKLEQRYPIPAPFNLLFLRVFGQSDVSSLASEWRPFGAFLMLGGPDTAGASMHDMYYAFTGRAGEVVIENPAELEAALSGLAAGLDSHLRYPAQALQCTDSTWTAALDRLLPMAHVVAMDLSSFSSGRGGSVYEIGRLVDEVPTEQVTLFVFDTTDMEAVERTVRAAWNQMSATSPNRRARPGRLRIVNSQGFAARARSDPRLADAEARERLAGDLGDRIRGLLCDAAEAGVTAKDPEYAVRADVIDWGRTGMPMIVRRFGVWLVAVGVFTAAMAILSRSNEARWVAATVAGLAWIIAIDRVTVTRSETLVGKGRWHRRPQ